MGYLQTEEDREECLRRLEQERRQSEREPATRRQRAVGMFVIALAVDETARQMMRGF